MQDSSLHSVESTQIFNGHITEEIIYQEFVKMGMQDFIANDLSKRYYRNELTYKDIEYLESNFNLKFEMLERSLKSEIIFVKTELDNKIDSVENNLNVKIDTRFNELDNKIDYVESNLNVKIDTKFNDLDNKIDIVKNELKSEISLVRKDMEINKMELNSKLDKTTSEFKSTSRLHNWMFGTLITLNIGIFLTLISIVYSLLNK
ncbi:Bdr family repetitive protein [Borrelia puertoricensis]|uniref:Bdr family repetitive protein n=1 Tax=Borrelia puertoricensis TaxID=2756107 RepID=UPI001FF3BD64|nr:Bdr family repetitive protein [Borrelia puertoricensis]